MTTAEIAINYFPSNCSPILTTSPAPIVINRSPASQLFSRKFSISSKVGKYSHDDHDAPGSVPADPWKRFQDYLFLLLHKCLPEPHDRQA